MLLVDKHGYAHSLVVGIIMSLESHTKGEYKQV